jgi:hypothetical protein
MRLIKKTTKPQNQINENVKASAIGQVREWLKGEGLPGYQANLLAVSLVETAISHRIAKTHETAPDVLLSDNDKVESLVMNARRIAAALDEVEQLDVLLGKLEAEDAANEGNSI